MPGPGWPGLGVRFAVVPPPPELRDFVAGAGAAADGVGVPLAVPPAVTIGVRF